MFDAGFVPADSAFAGRTPDRVEESDEVYVLSVASDASVKVRDGMMDVKHRLEVDDDGLEQWKPVLKAPFPLAADDVASVFATLAVPAPPLERGEYMLEQFLEELVAGRAGLLALPLQKHRSRHTVAGAMAELTEIRTAGGGTWTVAAESEEPALVLDAVRELGLQARRIVCVAAGLKALVGFGARRYAVVDVGTNSVKFHVGERGADGAWRSIVDRAEVTRLGEGVDDGGRLGAGPVERTVATIAAMAAEARGHDVEAIAAVGTAGLRAAPNAHELVDAVAERAGTRVEVIPGEEEARLAYLAAIAGLGSPRGSHVVFDTGGGSSQFTFGRGERIDERFSVPVGAVRFTERFGLDGVVTEDTLATALTAIAAELTALDGRPVPDVLVGMGGAITNLAAVKHGLADYDPDVVQGTVLDRDEIERQIERYRTRTTEERRTVVGLQPARAEVILAGACIVRTVVALLGRDSLVVSDRGLRHGVLVERFGAPAAGAPARA
jgi:exopolyphosphatase/guanosine-5'-triphosphate,3'-diphosphate pyrophosphatase